MEIVTGVVILDQVRQSRESMGSMQTPHTHPLSVADLSPLPCKQDKREGDFHCLSLEDCDGGEDSACACGAHSRTTAYHYSTFPLAF